MIMDNYTLSYQFTGFKQHHHQYFMKVLLVGFCLLFFTTGLFAQSYSQYNTGTLYDSFENPSQKSFTPDSSRMFATNFLIPNIDGNFFLRGNAQQTVKSRYFNGDYNNKNLVVGPGNNYNYLNGSANAYELMFKMFTSLNGNTEVGFFIQSKATIRGTITDESVALFDGSTSFPNNSYSNVFNSRYNYQIYNQTGFTYREQVTKQLAVGIKLAYVSGSFDGDVNIQQSGITYDKPNDTATLYLKGVNREVGSLNERLFKNPGMSASIGATYVTDDKFSIQGNIKDLGFIYWNRFTKDYNFNSSATIYDLTSTERETAAYDAYNAITTSSTTAGNGKSTNYTTPLDGTAELSVSKSFWVDNNNLIKYSPTLIASKELFYNSFIGVWVNPVQYENYTVTLTASYDDLKIFNLGGQFMIKSPNAEFFIGSDKLAQSANLLESQLKSHTAINATGAFTGGDIFIGFSMKFGPVIEHPMNASVIPLGEEKGFLGRIWDKLFNPNVGTIQNY